MLINSNNNNVKHDYFDSTEDFIAWYRNTPIVGGILGDHRSSVNGSSSFAGTESLSESLSKGILGDPSLAEEIRPKDLELEQTGALNAPVYDYAGDNVDVGLFCSGEPECMATMQRKGKPIIKLIVNGSASCFINSSTILARGRAILEIMSGLESNGYGTEIVWVTSSQQNTRLAIKLKDAKEYFDLHKMAFWLVCPSVLRRLSFGWKERLSKTWQNKLGYGYGSPTDVSDSDLAEESDHVYFPIIKSNDHTFFQKQIAEVLKKYAVI